VVGAGASRFPHRRGECAPASAAVGPFDIHAFRIDKCLYCLLHSSIAGRVSEWSTKLTYGDGREHEFEAFEWDEAKRRRNLDTHGIDFEDAAAIFFCGRTCGVDRTGAARSALS
jgi:hypothetical protein